MKYKIWNKTDPLITPIGTMQTPEEVFVECPASKVLDYVICDAVINKGVFMEYTATKENARRMISDLKKARPDWNGIEITDTMTQQEVLNAMTFFEEHQPLPLPSAEERVAAAMEFQNLMSL